MSRKKKSHLNKNKKTTKKTKRKKKIKKKKGSRPRGKKRKRKKKKKMKKGNIGKPICNCTWAILSKNDVQFFLSVFSPL